MTSAGYCEFGRLDSPHFRQYAYTVALSSLNYSFLPQEAKDNQLESFEQNPGVTLAFEYIHNVL